MQFWSNLPDKAKNQLSLAACVLLLLALLSVYVTQARQIDNTQSAMAKVAQRQAKAPKAAAAPADSPEALRSQLSQVDGQVKELRQRLDALNARLVPLDDAEALQLAQLAVSRAAAAAGLQVTRFGPHGAPAPAAGSAQQGAAVVAPDPRKLTDNPFQRPLFDFTATASTSYAGLMAFLGALQRLDYAVAPVQFAARIRTGPATPGAVGAGRTPAGAAARAQAEARVQGQPQPHWLEIEMVLAL